MSIKIYKDRSKCLIILSNEHIPWHDLEGVQDGPVKEGVLAWVVRYEVKTWSSTTAE